MRTVKLTERSSAKELLPEGGTEDVLVMRDGRPVALVTPIDEDDLEWYAIERSPEFIESIRRAREQVARGETVTQEELDNLLSDELDGLDLANFSPPVSIATLERTKCLGVPDAPGVYVILHPKRGKPEFRDRSSGGWFKGKDPSDPAEFVRAHWVEGATVVYVGKADGRNGLRQRICQLLQFGMGKPVGHRGGRLLWNLRDHQRLFVRWYETGEQSPREVESQLIERFRGVRGARPFANLKD